MENSTGAGNSPRLFAYSWRIFRYPVSLRTSAHTGVAIRTQSLPLGEGGSRVSRKRETDEGEGSPC